MSGPSRKKLPSPRAIFWQSVFFGLLAFSLLAGISGLVYGLSREALITEIRDGLQRTSKVAAASVDGDTHGDFTRAEQESSPEYQTAIAPLRRITEASPQIAFAYSAVLRDGKVYFVLDATMPPAPGEKDESVSIMELYDPPPPDLLFALQNKEAVVTKEPYTDEWGTFISAYAPIFDHQKAFVGVVGVDLKIDNFKRRLTSIQQVSYIASAISLLISIAIGVALYWQRKTDRNIAQLKRQFRIVDGLLNVSSAVGSNVGLENILPILIEKTSEVMNAQRAHLYLLSPDKTAFVRWHQNNTRIPANLGVLGQAAQTGQLINVPDTSKDAHYLDEASYRPVENVQSLMVAPIRSNKGEVFALLEAQNRQGGQGFDQDDENLLNALASQTQVALEREKLAQLAMEKRQLEQSLKFAQTIQLGMLPKVPNDWRNKGIDLAAHLVPAKIVGGDFFDFFYLENDQIGLVIADVSGKGVPAALFMAKAMTLIRAFATVGKAPADVLYCANEELVKDNAAAMFVTVFMAVLDLATGELRYANGGHNAPLLLRDGDVRELSDALAVPLGTMEGMDFTEASLSLVKGDLLYLFTDGVNESMNPEEEEFGDKRMQAMVRDYVAPYPAQGMIETTLEHVKAHAREEPQSDDITLLVLRYVGSESG